MDERRGPGRCVRSRFARISLGLSPDNSPAFLNAGTPMTMKNKSLGTKEPRRPMATLKGLKKLQGYNGLSGTLFCLDGMAPAPKAYLFSAKGAAFISSLGQRPRIRATPNRQR
jgi:hypothetical protein